MATSYIRPRSPEGLFQGTRASYVTRNKHGANIECARVFLASHPIQCNAMQSMRLVFVTWQTNGEQPSPREVRLVVSRALRMFMPMLTVSLMMCARLLRVGGKRRPKFRPLSTVVLLLAALHLEVRANNVYMCVGLT